MTENGDADLSGDRIQVLVGADLLYLSLVAGVIPTTSSGDSGAVARVTRRVVDGTAGVVPKSSVAVEFAIADWERAQEHGLAAVHDVRRFIFGDDKKRDHLQSTMSPELGFPAFPLPFESTTEASDPWNGLDNLVTEEPGNADAFVNLEYNAHAAVALTLLEQMKRIGAERLGDLHAMGSSAPVTLDHPNVVAILSRIAGTEESTIGLALEWASVQSKSNDDPKARLKELVSRLSRCPEVAPKLERFRSTTEGIMDGEVLADPKLLFDDGTVVLRALSVLFRVADMNLATVEGFLNAEEKSDHVGIRVRAVASCLAAASTGGFKSLRSPFKSEKDLFALGSCLAAGQQERVGLRRTSGNRGFEVLLDGTPLDYFSDKTTRQETVRNDVSPLIELLKMRAREAGYAFHTCADPMLATAPTVEEGRAWQTYLIDGDIIVEFDPANEKQFQMRIDCSFEIGKKKKLPPAFFERASTIRKGGELVCRGHWVSLYRDHHGTDLNTDELRGHVESLRGGHALIRTIWATLKSGGKLEKTATRKNPTDNGSDDQPVPKPPE